MSVGVMKKSRVEESTRLAVLCYSDFSGLLQPMLLRIVPSEYCTRVRDTVASRSLYLNARQHTPLLGRLLSAAPVSSILFRYLSNQ